MELSEIKKIYAREMNLKTKSQSTLHYYHIPKDKLQTMYNPLDSIF